MRTEMFFAAALLLASPALAQQGPCGPVDVVLKSLHDEAKEVPAGVGRDVRGVMAMMTPSPDGSYSMLVIRPDGIACVLSTGEGWTPVEGKPPGRGA